MRQITPSKANFIEKIVRDTNGRLLRATFCVYENGGHIKARLLSVVYVEESAIENKTPLLSFSSLGEEKHQEIIFENKTVSPYFNSNILYSSGSKPRAPTF